MLAFQRPSYRRIRLPEKIQPIQVSMITEYPEKQVFSPEQAQACLDENRYDEAVKMAEVRLEEAPGDVEAMIILCQGLLRLGKLDRLRALLAEVDETIGRLSQVYQQLGTLCGKSGLNVEALNFLHKYNALAAALSPEGNWRLPEATGDLADEEEESVEAGGEISPEFYTTTLADLYIQQGHHAMAKEVLEVILAKEPANEQVSRKLADLAKLMTVDDIPMISEPAEVESLAVNGAILAELERWLARVSRLRSPAA